MLGSQDVRVCVLYAFVLWIVCVCMRLCVCICVLHENVHVSCMYVCASAYARTRVLVSEREGVCAFM